MSLLGRVARGIMRLVPVDREGFAERSAVHRATLRLAESESSDEDAKRELQTAIAEHPAGIQPTLDLMSGMRDSYVRDRSYRLLRGAADDSPVEVVPPDSAELFRREEQLGRMPIKDAFALLADLVPSLHDLESDARAGRLRPSGKPPQVGRAAVPLGRAWKHDDPLLRSDLALSIASQYLDAVAGVDRLTDVESAYFAAPRKRHISSGVLFGGPQDPPLPRS